MVLFFNALRRDYQITIADIFDPNDYPAVTAVIQFTNKTAF